MPAELLRTYDRWVGERSTRELGGDLAALGAVLADRTRAGACLLLLDNRRWTCSELASALGVARSTMTEHANTLVAAGLLEQQRVGRHRYLRLAGDDAAEFVEFLASRAPRRADGARSLRSVSIRTALSRGRTCYDHLAGVLGVQVTQAMIEREFLRSEHGWTITSAGLEWLASVGADVEELNHGRRQLVRQCLDWTEQQPHLAGQVGAAVCTQFFANGWIARYGTNRAVRVTDRGETALSEQLSLSLGAG